MDAGVSSKNTRRYIDINAIAQKLTPSICLALPSFHAFTGCDYTSSFFRKAKSRPFDLLVKDRRFASAFGQLGSSRSVGAEVGAIIEEYVCAMYGVRNVTDVNEARYHLFRKLYAPTKPDQPLEKIKSSDPCCLPPCKTVLEQKFRRTTYVARIWRNARLAQPVELGPDGHGWRVVNDKLQSLQKVVCSN